jgi:hypothetical protein
LLLPLIAGNWLFDPADHTLWAQATSTVTMLFFDLLLAGRQQHHASEGQRHARLEFVHLGVSLDLVIIWLGALSLRQPTASVR